MEGDAGTRQLNPTDADETPDDFGSRNPPRIEPRSSQSRSTKCETPAE